MNQSTEKLFGTGLFPGLNKVCPVAYWKPYSGFSYLFDNKGNSLSNNKDLSLIDCKVYENSELNLYKHLYECVQSIGGDELINKCLLFTLPSSTYHVTAYDGVNIENITNLSREGQEAFRGFIENPNELYRLLPVIIKDKFSEIVRGGISFRFKDIHLSGNTVLMAKLEPSTSADRKVFDTIMEERQRLDNSYFNTCQKPRNIGYTPHVALGYFSNSEIAALAWKNKSYDWSKHFKDNMSDDTIEFPSISLYAFSDMLTYFKKA